MQTSDLRMGTHEIQEQMAAGDWRGALAGIAGLLDRSPGNAAYHALAGDCLYELKEFRRAAEEYRKACVLDPRHVAAAARYAICLEHANDFEEAVRVAQEWLHTDPNSAALQGVLERLLPVVTGGRLEGWEQTRHLERRVVMRDEDVA